MCACAAVQRAAHTCAPLPPIMNIHDPQEEDNNIGIKHLEILLVFNIS